MPTKRETTNVGVLGSLQRFHVKLEANGTDLAHLEVPRAQLGTLLTRADDLNKQQGAMRASKQEASKELQALIAEGQRLSTGLRSMIKIHYGPTSEKLSEFDIQPFRGRKVKAAAASPTPETPVTPAGPQATAPPSQVVAKD